jgi:hypothetical protein
MRYNNNAKDLSLQLSIINEQGEDVKTTTISLEDYIDETIGKQCQNVADNIISNMIKKINQEKEIQK